MFVCGRVEEITCSESSPGSESDRGSRSETPNPRLIPPFPSLLGKKTKEMLPNTMSTFESISLPLSSAFHSLGRHSGPSSVNHLSMLQLCRTLHNSFITSTITSMALQTYKSRLDRHRDLRSYSSHISIRSERVSQLITYPPLPFLALRPA